MGPFPMAILASMAIMNAAFLLLWACDAAQADISQGLALAVVALIAVLPEYSVDMYFTWQAGQFPDSDYASYAAANMTGANRLVISVGWPAIVLITWLKTRQAVRLPKERRTEIVLLAVATLYAFVIPIRGPGQLRSERLLVDVFVRGGLQLPRRFARGQIGGPTRIHPMSLRPRCSRVGARF